jgi:ubiquinone biosynthesis protein COQ4
MGVPSPSVLELQMKTDERPRVDPAAGVRAAVTWVQNPISEQGTRQIFRMLGSFGGPAFVRMSKIMRVDETGRRILDERPDLGATLNDMSRLAAMPEGSLGRVYHDFLSGPNVAPGYLISGTMHWNGYFRNLAWPEEHKYLFQRMGATHDLMHVLGGYGSDISAEVVNATFSAAYYAGFYRAPYRLVGFTQAAITALAFRPRVGVGPWLRANVEAADRGYAAFQRRPFCNVYWEEQLERPIDEVRCEVGIPPLRHLEGDTASYHTTRFAHRVADGMGGLGETQAWIRDGRAMVEMGVPYVPLMEAGEETREQLRALVRAEAPLQDFVAVLKDAGLLEEAGLGAAA